MRSQLTWKIIVFFAFGLFVVALAEALGAIATAAIALLFAGSGIYMLKSSKLKTTKKASPVSKSDHTTKTAEALCLDDQQEAWPTENFINQSQRRLVGDELWEKISRAAKPIDYKKLMRECGYSGFDENGQEYFERTLFTEELDKQIADAKSQRDSMQKTNKGKKAEKRSKQNEGHGKLKLTIVETGGHYTIGRISDSNIAKQLKKRIMRSQMSSYFEFDRHSCFDARDCNELLDIYGPHVPGSQLIIEDYRSNEIYCGPFDDSPINGFQASNPYVTGLMKTPPKSSDELIVFNKRIEKRIHYSVEIHAESNMPLKLEEIYVGYCLMDETFDTDDEILEYVLYIPDEQALEYYIDWIRQEDCDLDGSESADDFRECIGEIFDDPESELCTKIVNMHRVSAEAIEGKGEWECDYIKVAEATSENFLSEVLYEDDGY